MKNLYNLIMKYKNLIYHLVVIAGLITFFTLYMNERSNYHEFRDEVTKKLYEMHNEDMKIINGMVKNQKIIINKLDSLLLKEIK